MDLSSITDPFSGSGIVSGSCAEFWRTLGYSPSSGRVPRSLDWRSFHFSTKSGPNGQAMAGSLKDLFSLPTQQVLNIKTQGGNNLAKRVMTLWSRPELFSRGSGSIRKLSSFPDREDKVRVIAIQDFWSQTALRPLHSFLYGVLRKIPQDHTFNQGAFKNSLANARVFYSIDLSSATDRFPIELISRVLGGLLPSWYVAAWKDIMVGYPFDTPGGGVRYAVGNPMGAYSSWATFAVAHHFLVYDVCRELGVDWPTLPYALLGDDIVIGHVQVAERYLSRQQELGVGVSRPKTHVSAHFLEFAKRIQWNGTEVTPFPVAALSEAASRFYLLVNVILDVTAKGWHQEVSIYEAIVSFYSSVFNKRTVRSRALGTKGAVSERIQQYIRGALPGSICLRDISVQLGFSEVSVTDSDADFIFRDITGKLFAESFKSTSRGNLGELAENLVIQMYSYSEDFSVVSDMILAHPQIQAHGLVSDVYTKVIQNVLDIHRKGEDWPLLLRALTIPMSDSVYVIRQADMVPRASSRYIKHQVSTQRSIK